MEKNKSELGGTFSDAVSEALGHYVYRLIDPRNGETFYVGKGQGNRIFHHARNGGIPESDDDAMSPKNERITAIKKAGLQVLHVIHRHNIQKDAVNEVEAALIDAYPGLSNDQGGIGSRDRGPMHAQEIIEKYDLPPLAFDPPYRLILINVNAIEDRSTCENILTQVRFAWRLDPHRASKAEYVLAVRRGVVIGVFQAARWKPATKTNFPEFGVDRPGRYGFHPGKPVDNLIWREFAGVFGKRIINKEMLHVQNPIRYWKI